jgi:hypothetical protein
VNVVEQTAQVEDGKITEYRTTVNVAFVIKYHSHLIGPDAKAAVKDF